MSDLSTEKPVLATVGDVKVMRHDPRPCTFCGHVYESGCCGRRSCPACGRPTKPALNAGPPEAEQPLTATRGTPAPPAS